MGESFDIWDVVCYAVAIFVIIVVFLVGIKVIEFFRVRQYYKKLVKDFDGPTPHWLLGNIPIIPEGIEGLEVGVELTKKYGSIFTVWFGNRAGLQVSHPDTLRTILNSTEPKDPILYAFVVPWIGDGLLVSQVSNLFAFYTLRIKHIVSKLMFLSFIFFLFYLSGCKVV